MIEQQFVERIAAAVDARPRQVAVAIQLLDKGASVPFIARYRKDLTLKLDERRLERIEELNLQYTALISRRRALLENAAKQKRLTPELRTRIVACVDSHELEDLYLPFKKRQRNRASVARDKGLERLADYLWNQQFGDESLISMATSFVDSERGVSSPEEALGGAADILSERIAMDPDARAWLRQKFRDEGQLRSLSTKNAETGGRTRLEEFYDNTEQLTQMDPNRLLAVMRGVRLGVLRIEVLLEDDAAINELVSRYVREGGSAFEPIIRTVADDAFRRHLRPLIESEVLADARNAADAVAIEGFRDHARAMLMAPPAGPIPLLGISPASKTEFYAAAVGANGAVLGAAPLKPGDTEESAAEAREAFTKLVKEHGLLGVAVMNSPGSREAVKFARETLRAMEAKDVFTAYVNETGVPVYAGSKVAKSEMPDLDVQTRSAVSVARRLQDPLSELVKLDPKALGAGPFQHDVNQKKLRDALQRTVASCVNAVGVNVNTAHEELLSYVCGIQQATAANIIAYRTEHGAFKAVSALLEVSGIGEKTYEQCAGFLRVYNGEQALDATAVHPEAYPVVERLAASINSTGAQLLQDPAPLEGAVLDRFAYDVFGIQTLLDVRRELKRPSRDPRPRFRVPRFAEGLHSIDDLQEGLETEGVITNVTDFGAFVDVGIHQDGLVHLSELTRRFVRDPRQVVKLGDVVRVKVIKVERDSGRISLSIKATQPEPAPRPRRGGDRPQRGSDRDRAPRGDQGQAPYRPQRQDDSRPQRGGQGAPRRDGEGRPAQVAAAAGTEQRSPRGGAPQRGDGDGERESRQPRRQDGGRRDSGRGGRSDRDQDSGGSRDNRRGQRGGQRAQAKPQGMPSAVKHSDSDSGVNTLLADQLARLKEQLEQ